MTEYRIIRDPILQIVIDEVNAALADGWELVGGMYSDVALFMQTVVRDVPKKRRRLSTQKRTDKLQEAMQAVATKGEV